jgi:RNA polymerase sigma factor (sigma-70 family)
VTNLHRLTDAELLRARDPQGDAFAEFYRRQVDHVLRFLAARGLDAWTAADVTTETFIAALRGRRRFDAGRGDALTWLLGIARNKSADIARRSQREARLVARIRRERPAVVDEDIAAYQALQRDVLAECADLTSLQRAALEARIVKDRSYADVGHALGVSEVAARQHVSRGLAVLRSTTIIVGKEI